MTAICLRPGVLPVLLMQTEELAASIEALEVRLAGAQDPLQQEAALRACLQDLHQLRQQQAAEAAAGEALREQLRRLQEQHGQLEQQIETAQQEQKAAEKQAAQAAQAVKGAAAALQKLGVDRKQAVRDFSGTDAVHAFSSGILKAPAAAAADPAGAGSGGAAPTESQLQQLGRRARQLQGKLSRLDVPQLLPGQKVWVQRLPACRLAHAATGIGCCLFFMHSNPCSASAAAKCLDAAAQLRCVCAGGVGCQAGPGC